MKARDQFRQCHTPESEQPPPQAPAQHAASTLWGAIGTLAVLLVLFLGAGADSLLPDRSATADAAAAQRNDERRQQLIDQAAYRKQLRQAHDQGMREVLDALASDARGEAFAQACMALQQTDSGVRP